MKLRTAEQGISTDANTQEILRQTKELYGLDQPIPISTSSGWADS